MLVRPPHRQVILDDFVKSPAVDAQAKKVFGVTRKRGWGLKSLSVVVRWPWVI